MKKIILRVLTFFLCVNLFSQINVISPVSGQWSNKQMLVIDNQDNAEYFYSLNNENPKVSGLAYDGPVLIDMTGSVTLRVLKAGSNQELKIDYTVEENPASESDYGYFINQFFDSGEINYTAGTTLAIPEELYFAIGEGSKSFLPGCSLNLAQNTVLSRTVPCVIQDPAHNLNWRFVINIFPQTYGLFSKRTLPFSITDWDTINFEDKNLIYKIDDEYWELPKSSKKIDRTKPHTIYWQSLSYELGNPVEFFDLPVKPQLVKEETEDGALLLKFVSDDDYKMSIFSVTKNEYQELFSEIGIDTFYGDCTSGTITVGVFYNSFYQGEMKTSYKVNKRPPLQPQIAVKEKGFYSRDVVYPVISCDKQDELYVSISKPFYITDNSETYTSQSSIFEQVEQEPFFKVDGNTYVPVLDATEEGSCYYAIKAYSKNANNKSLISEYSVIIDKYNYYYCESGNSELANGTADFPYTDFKQCFQKINNGRYAKLMIKGQMHIPSGKNEILSNCTLINQDDGELIFKADSTLVIKSASFEVQDFTILLEKDSSNIETSSSSKEAIPSLFKIESGVIDFINCQIGANFITNGTLVDAFNSSVNIRQSVVSVTASKYVSCITGAKANFTVINSIVNVNGNTVVLASLNKGNLNIHDNSFKLTGQIGRVFELFNIYGQITKNEFKSELSNKNSSSVIFQDSKCNITIADNNDYGF